MEFPKKEADIVCLADRMYHGFFRHSVDFPKISKVLLMVTTNRFEIAKKDLLLSRAALKVAVKAKQQNFSNLKTEMKKCLKLAEVDCRDNPAKLSLIGIGWAAKKSAQNLCPAQPENLTCEQIAKDKIKLLWQRPNTNSGGAVHNYIIHRRHKQADGKMSQWILAAIAYETISILSNQPAGLLEYQVKAANKAGTSLPTNTAAIGNGVQTSDFPS